MKMTEREYLLLSDAMRTVGLNEETIHYNFERFTWDEYERMNGFVNWMIETGTSMGRANYQERWAEYLDSQGGEPMVEERLSARERAIKIITEQVKMTRPVHVQLHAEDLATDLVDAIIEAVLEKIMSDEVEEGLY